MNSEIAHVFYGSFVILRAKLRVISWSLVPNESSRNSINP